MGLEFQVGSPARVLLPPLRTLVTQGFAAQFGDLGWLHSEYPVWRARPVPWSGWEALQVRATHVLSPRALPHFTNIRTGVGVFLPVPTAPCQVAFPGVVETVSVSNTESLMQELERLSPRLDLPTDPVGLAALLEVCEKAEARDVDSVEREPEVATFARLYQSALEASERGAPLWVLRWRLEVH